MNRLDRLNANIPANLFDSKLLTQEAPGQTDWPAYCSLGTPSTTNQGGRLRPNEYVQIAEPPVGYTGWVRLRPPDPEYVKLLQPYGEVIQKLALAVRKLTLEEAPEASEFVYQVYTIADHFTFTERPSDAFVFTTTHANWVNLGFNFGSLLSDPDGLLRGEGKLIRHVRIAQATDLDAQGVRELVRAAIAQAEQPEGKVGKPRTVVRTAQSVRKRSAPSRRRTRYLRT